LENPETLATISSGGPARQYRETHSGSRYNWIIVKITEKVALFKLKMIRKAPVLIIDDAKMIESWVYKASTVLEILTIHVLFLSVFEIGFHKKSKNGLY
jgi:hypothetical protein